MLTQLKKKLLSNWKLYVVTESILAKDAEKILAEAVEGGASVIQLRDKLCRDEEMVALARKLHPVTQRMNVPLIINDRVSVALKAGADGVHLGQEDASFREARQMLGQAALIGRSTHSEEQIVQAVLEGFDYIGVGPVFSTPTKPDYVPVGLDLVRFAARNVTIPFVAIGGINETNAAQVREAGAKTIAVVRAVMQSRDPRKSAANLIKD